MTQDTTNGSIEGHHYNEQQRLPGKTKGFSSNCEPTQL